MTSFSTTFRRVGAGLLGLGVLASLSGGCGGNSTDAVTSDFGSGTQGSNASAPALTRVQYEFTRARLQVGTGAAFYDVALRDSSGKIVSGVAAETGGFVLANRFAAADSVQMVVPNEAVSSVASTTIDVLLSDGTVREHFEQPLTLQQGQSSVVSNGTPTTAALSTLTLRTSDKLVNEGIASTGVLTSLAGTPYQLVTLATYSAGTSTTSSNISATANGITFTVNPTSLGSVRQGGIFEQSRTAAAGANGTITVAFQGKSATLPVNVSGLTAPSPTPPPAASPTPQPSASPTPTPSPGISPSPVPSPSPSSASTLTDPQLILLATTLQAGASTPFGILATVNGTAGVNITTAPVNQFVNISITSTNSNVANADTPNLVIRSTQAGNATLRAIVGFNAQQIPSNSPVQVTVTP